MTVDRALNDIMEFDHVIEVHADGSITDRPDVYAPDLYDDVIVASGWEFFTTGYSRQDGYAGPIMHASEFIGGRLEYDIRTTPGVYVALVAYYYDPDSDASDDDGYYAEGWAVATLAETDR